jgi:cation/acetate symporter
MTGTASLPHVLIHPLMTRGMGEARTSAVWSLFFIALLVLTLPTYMTLSSSAELHKQGGVLAGLVPAIAVTSMLAAMSALLLTIANCLEHDVYRRLFPWQKSSKWQPMVGRVFILLVTATALYAAGRSTFEPVSLLAWAFSLAAAGFFPALVLGIWWSRTTAAGAVCGIISGLGLCSFYLATNADAANGVFGLAVGFLVTAAISLLGEKPSAQKQAFLDALRAPVSKPVL